MASHSPQERTFVSDARSLLIQSVISTTVLPLSGVQSLPAPDKKKKKWRTELRLVRSWNMGTAAGWRGFLFAPTLCHRPLILRSPAHARGASPLVGQIASVQIIERLTLTTVHTGSVPPALYDRIARQIPFTRPHHQSACVLLDPR
jgi:hypothetical protein